jgi:hypothetical protein
MIEYVEVVIENDNNLEIKTTSNVCKKRGHASLNGVVTDIKIHGESWRSNNEKAWQMCKQTKNEHSLIVRQSTVGVVWGQLHKCFSVPFLIRCNVCSLLRRWELKDFPCSARS